MLCVESDDEDDVTPDVLDDEDDELHAGISVDVELELFEDGLEAELLVLELSLDGVLPEESLELLLDTYSTHSNITTDEPKLNPLVVNVMLPLLAKTHG